VRRSVDLRQLTTNNEIAGFKFATVGVIFAVIARVVELGSAAEKCRAGSRIDSSKWQSPRGAWTRLWSDLTARRSLGCAQRRRAT
jgi:hypothetical protein